MSAPLPDPTDTVSEPESTDQTLARLLPLGLALLFGAGVMLAYVVDPIRPTPPLVPAPAQPQLPAPITDHASDAPRHRPGTNWSPPAQRRICRAGSADRRPYRRVSPPAVASGQTRQTASGPTRGVNDTSEPTLRDPRSPLH